MKSISSVKKVVIAGALLLAVLAGNGAAAPQPRSVRSDVSITHHRTAKVDGIEMFYREAGPRTGR